MEMGMETLTHRNPAESFWPAERGHMISHTTVGVAFPTR